MPATRIFDKFKGLLDVLWTSIPDGGLLKRNGNNVESATGIGVVTLSSGGVQSVITQPGSALVGIADSQTLVNKTIAGANNTLDVRLGSDVSGNLPVSRLNGGSGASASTFWRGDATWQVPAGGGAAAFSRGHLVGLGLSNNVTDATNDIDVAEGECRDSTNAADMVLASALTKRLDAAWTVGTGQGGLDTGAIANTTYHVFLIKRSDTGVVDSLFSTSPSAPTLPTNYTHFRRVGSIMRVAGAIEAFSQRGDEFLKKTPTLDVNGTIGTSEWFFTLVVPTGIKVEAKIVLFGASNAITITSPDQNDIPGGGGLGYTVGNQITATTIRTNTLGQVRARGIAAGTGINIGTHGWIDTRGRDD